MLTHEVAHSRLHFSARRAETTKCIRETEAEAVAFVVGQAIGLRNQFGILGLREVVQRR